MSKNELRREQWVYVEGMDRNDQHKVVSHIYTGPSNSDLKGPLCKRGWNRSDGTGFSIFRGNKSDAGTCKVCLKRKAAGKSFVEPSKRKTRWI